MNILLIHQYFLEKNDGGGSRFNEMTRIWAEAGHHITVIAGMVHYTNGKKPNMYKGKWLYKDLEFYQNVDVIRTHVSESYNKNFLGRLWAYFSFMFSSIWAGIFTTKKKYNIIIASSPPIFVGITALILSLIKGCPYIFEIRDLWPESAIDTNILRNKLAIKIAYKTEQIIYKNSSKINVLTPAFKESLIYNKNIQENKIMLHPNAADLDLSERIMKTTNIEKSRLQLSLKDKFVLTYIGAHGVANHLIQLINAAELLKDTNAFFILVGDGMQKPSLIKEVEYRKLNNVKFIDLVPKSDVFKYILASDMGISVLKKNDTFKTIYSNKTFDYMACKKPVLLGIDGMSRKLIEKAKCGIYVEPENANQMAKEIRKLLKSPNQLEKMGENGYEYVKRNFDRNIIAHKYLKDIENTAKKSKNFSSSDKN